MKTVFASLIQGAKDGTIQTVRREVLLFLMLVMTTVIVIFWTWINEDYTEQNPEVIQRLEIN